MLTYTHIYFDIVFASHMLSSSGDLRSVQEMLGQ